MSPADWGVNAEIIAAALAAVLLAALILAIMRAAGRERPVPPPGGSEIGGDAIDEAIETVSGAGGPSDAEIERMTRDYYRKGDRP